MLDGAPQLHEPDITHPNVGKNFGNIYDATHNIAAHEIIRHGDFDAAMQEADIIVEGEYHVPYISHAVLEPHVCVAYLDGYERTTVVNSTEGTLSHSQATGRSSATAYLACKSCQTARWRRLWQ